MEADARLRVLATIDRYLCSSPEVPRQDHQRLLAHGSAILLQRVMAEATDHKLYQALIRRPAFVDGESGAVVGATDRVGPRRQIIAAWQQDSGGGGAIDTRAIPVEGLDDHIARQCMWQGDLDLDKAMINADIGMAHLSPQDKGMLLIVPDDANEETRSISVW